jgi:ABC-type polysaccharide/polyol phosphate export permease
MPHMMKSYFTTELRDCFTRSELWLYMAWLDIKLRYRRTKLGPLWMVLFTFVTTICTATLASVLFKMNWGDFFPYVCCGMIVWAYVAGLITDSCNTFLAQSPLIKNTNVPLLNFGLRMFVKNTIVFFHSLVIAACVILYFDVPITLNLLLLFPALFLFFITSVSLSVILGFLCTRYRDILQLIQSTLGLLVFVTPIMWKAEMLGSRAYLMNFNPLTHFVILIREPLLGNTPSVLNYTVAAGFSGFLLLITYFFYNKYRKRLVHWL